MTSFQSGWVPHCWRCGTTFGVSRTGSPYCISCRNEQALSQQQSQARPQRSYPAVDNFYAMMKQDGII